MIYIVDIYLWEVTTAKLFMNGRSQAVRLPKEFRFAGKNVKLKRLGAAVVMLPEGDNWDILFEACEAFSADFMRTRKQPATQKRAALDQ
jgi:antitoxin VapB